MGSLLIWTGIYGLLWLVIFVFIYKMTARQQVLQQSLTELEQQLNDDDT